MILIEITSGLGLIARRTLRVGRSRTVGQSDSRTVCPRIVDCRTVDSVSCVAGECQTVGQSICVECRTAGQSILLSTTDLDTLTC